MDGYAELGGIPEDGYVRGPGKRTSRWDFGRVIYKRHICYDAAAPGGQVACFCPIREDHDVAAFNDLGRVK